MIGKLWEQLRVFQSDKWCKIWVKFTCLPWLLNTGWGIATHSSFQFEGSKILNGVYTWLGAEKRITQGVQGTWNELSQEGTKSPDMQPVLPWLHPWQFCASKGATMQRREKENWGDYKKQQVSSKADRQAEEGEVCMKTETAKEHKELGEKLQLVRRGFIKCLKNYECT